MRKQQAMLLTFEKIMRKLISIIGCVILASCGKQKIAIVEPESYKECLVGDFKESEFSKWTFGPDMQMIFDSCPSDRYWAYQEGRSYKGTWQIRWVEKPFPRDKYSRWSARCLVPAATFYDYDVKMQKAGHKRISLQVFIDASGNAMHQGIWVKPLDKPVAGNLFEIKVVSDKAEPESSELTRTTDGHTETMHVMRPPLISTEDVAEVSIGDNPVVPLVKLSEEGAKKFAAQTARMKGKRIAIIVQGKIMVAPIINQAPLGSSFELSGFKDAAEAKAFVEAFNKARG